VSGFSRTVPKRVLVTGARGQLAGAILDVFGPMADVKAYSHGELDIADYDTVMACVERDRPDAIINCAAYNQVDLAEDEPERALVANAFGVRVLARAAEACGATLVHYSTDFVFDGNASQPYTEEDAPNPQSVYAQSKLLGEWFAAEGRRSFVLRVESLFGGSAAKGSIGRIAFAITNDQEARLFVDRIVSPSYIVDVAAATKALVERGHPGLYHCVGTGYSTWFELGEEIARIIGKDVEARLVPVSVATVQLRAPRPQFAALSNDKLCRLFPMPTWQDALRRYLSSR
jgi:dTDP-4-dehydrorhamnose reductase